MAKKHLGSLIALAAVAGAAAAGVSYFLRYKSFHKELEEDFHDFEEDEEEELFHEQDAAEENSQVKRTYVPLNTDKGDSGQQNEADGSSDGSEETDETTPSKNVPENTESTTENSPEVSTTIIEEEDSTP